MKSSKGEGGEIRASILAQVERCMYVESVDAQLREDTATGDDSPSSVVSYTESFRKHKWLQQRRQQQQQQLLKSRMESAQQKEQQEEEEAARKVLHIQQQLALELQRAAKVMAQKQAARRQRGLGTAMAKKMMANKRGTSVPLEFEGFLSEILTSDVDVSCSSSSSPLDAKPFDQLGAISIPCKREGNSVTLCCWHSREELEDKGGDADSEPVRHEQLILFGGRLLQDVTRLLPAAVLSDPMQLERVRYTYSNGVYSYDIASCVWTFRECTGSRSSSKLPRERSDHSAVFLEPHFLVIFGGRGRNGQVFKDLWVLNLVSWQWSEIDTDTKLVERYWHACCVNDDSVFVFGGKSEVIAHGDLQQLSVHSLREMLVLEDDAESSSSSSITKKKKKPKLSWMCPHTVGKTPSPRFGMSLITLDYERIAVVGGYRARKKPKKDDLQREPRRMDFHILDTVTMIWSTPRLSSHVSMLTTPTERMLFECFYQHNTVIVFGGFTYATNGETESHTPRDDSHVVYKLDINRMIWRRQSLNYDPNANWLPAPHVHTSSNAVLGDQGFTCFASAHQTLMQLAAFHIQLKAAPDGTKSRDSAPIDLLEQQGEVIPT